MCGTPDLCLDISHICLFVCVDSIRYGEVDEDVFGDGSLTSPVLLLKSRPMETVFPEHRNRFYLQAPTTSSRYMKGDIVTGFV